MSKSIQALREEKADKAKEVRKLLDDNTSPEAYAKVKDRVDALLADCATLDDQIRAWQTALDLEAANDIEAHARDISDRTRRSVDEETFKAKKERLAFVASLRDGVDRIAPEERELLNADWTSFLSAGEGRAAKQIKNIQEAAPGTAGVVVPTYVMSQLIAKLKAFGGMRDFAKIIGTDNGAPLLWGTYDTTTLKAAILPEGQFTPDIDVDLGSVVLHAFMYATGTVAISLQALQDMAVNIEGEILDILTTALARGQNADFTNGTGASQPQGVVTGAAVGYQAPIGNTATLSWDFLVQILHSLDPAYRNLPSAAWMFNDSTLKTIKMLKDTVGRPLWLPATSSSIEPGSFEPDTVLGKRYIVNQDMPSLGANNTPILFGAGEKYLIRDVMAAMILRFTDSAYARKLMVGFSGFMRSDGRYIDVPNVGGKYESVRLFQCSAT